MPLLLLRWDQFAYCSYHDDFYCYCYLATVVTDAAAVTPKLLLKGGLGRDSLCIRKLLPVLLQSQAAQHH